METVMYVCLLSTLLIATTISSSIGTRVTVGEKATLRFAYECGSTEVTLRHGNNPPFYSSSSSNSSALNPKYDVTNNNWTTSCSIDLTVHHVTRDDSGGYILTVYKNGQMLSDGAMVWLRVSYVPGKASCALRSVFGDDWVTLHCTAPAGSLSGQIVCYQGGDKILPSTGTEENGGMLDQLILARVAMDPVFCCSSISDQTRERCKCRDWIWNPTTDSTLTYLDPCPNRLPSTAIVQSTLTEVQSTSTIASQTTKDKYTPVLRTVYISLSSCCIIVLFCSLICFLRMKVNPCRAPREPGGGEYKDVHVYDHGGSGATDTRKDSVCICQKNGHDVTFC